MRGSVGIRRRHGDRLAPGGTKPGSVIAAWAVKPTPPPTESGARTLASARMNLDSPDEAPTDLLNRILWHDARGWSTAYPAVKHVMVFPFSVDVADEDRREKAPARKK
jgi:hypothetical protein